MGRDNRTHVADFGERRIVRLPDPEELSEVAREGAGRGLPYLRYPERVEEAGKGQIPAALDGLEQFFAESSPIRSRAAMSSRRLSSR